MTFLAPRLSEAMKKYNTYINYKNTEVLQNLAGFPRVDEQQFRFLFVSAVLLLMAASGGRRGRYAWSAKKRPTNWTTCRC